LHDSFSLKVELMGKNLENLDEFTAKFAVCWSKTTGEISKLKLRKFRRSANVLTQHSFLSGTPI
jgi:hypothetical protein